MIEWDNDNRILSESSAQKVLDEALSYAGKRGTVKIVISSWWGGGQRWARNAPTMTADQREVTFKVERGIGSSRGQAETNQIDSVSIKGAMEVAERYALSRSENNPLDKETDIAHWDFEGSNVWSDVTYNRLVTENAKSVNDITHKSIEDNLVSAGYIGNTASTALVYNCDDWGRNTTKWGRVTSGSCSVTVRHPKGVGSGWAGQSSYDIARWDVEKVADLAYEKCKLSLNPVRLEPGRYTTILEPQAVATLMSFLVGALNRVPPESGRASNPIYQIFDSGLRRHISKIGVKLVDSRLNVYHDPQDPLVGTHRSSLIRKVNMITQGIFTEGYNSIPHEINELNSNNPAIVRRSYRVDGGETSVDEMIKSTRRGLIVAKLDQAMPVDDASILLTGVTRDGLWLIENGTVTKSIRNFRWIESPLFVFNNIEQIGFTEPVFNQTWFRGPLTINFHDSLKNVVVPTMKVRDFQFSSMIDAI